MDGIHYCISKLSPTYMYTEKVISNLTVSP